MNFLDKTDETSTNQPNFKQPSSKNWKMIIMWISLAIFCVILITVVILIFVILPMINSTSSGPVAFCKKMANQVSLYDNEDLYEEFNLFNPNEKKLVLLDSGITQTVAEELLMREKDPTKFLTSEVIEKFDKKCGELCQQTKIVTLQEIDVAIDKSDQYYEKEEETINSVIDYCDKGSEVMSEISNAIGEFRAEFEPDHLKRKLNHHIDVANNPCYPKKKSSCIKKGYLTQTQFETMKKSVKDATNLDEIEETSAEIKRSM